MKNIGLKSSQWLASLGIHTLDDKEELRKQVEKGRPPPPHYVAAPPPKSL